MATSFDLAATLQAIGALPLERHAAGATVLAAGARSGRLLVLVEGSVAIAKDGVEICTVAEPGAVLGELAMLLDRPHTADVRTREPCAFRVADAETFLAGEPAAALYLALALARRVGAANRALAAARRGRAPDQPRSTLGRLLDKLASALRYDGGDGPFPWYSSMPPALLGALGRLPDATFRAGDLVLAAGTRTGRLWILDYGSAEVLSDGVVVGRVAAPGALLGELALLLDEPHGADVRACETTGFKVADAAGFLDAHPAAALHVASVIARRLDAANRALVTLRRELQQQRPDELPAAAVAEVARTLAGAG